MSVVNCIKKNYHCAKKNVVVTPLVVPELLTVQKKNITVTPKKKTLRLHMVPIPQHKVKICAVASKNNTANWCLLFTIKHYGYTTIVAFMMMIVPNSLVRQREGAKEEEEEEAGGRRKAGSTGIPTPGADAPIGPTRSGVSKGPG